MENRTTGSGQEQEHKPALDAETPPIHKIIYTVHGMSRYTTIMVGGSPSYSMLDGKSFLVGAITRAAGEYRIWDTDGALRIAVALNSVSVVIYAPPLPVQEDGDAAADSPSDSNAPALECGHCSTPLTAPPRQTTREPAKAWTCPGCNRYLVLYAPRMESQAAVVIQGTRKIATEEDIRRRYSMGD